MYLQSGSCWTAKSIVCSVCSFFWFRLCILNTLRTEGAYRVFPNCTARAKGVRQSLVGQQLLDKHDVSALRARRPCDRGYVVNWDLQREIWSHTFTSLLDISPASSGLLLTEPLFSLPAMQDATQQVTLLLFLSSTEHALGSVQHQSVVCKTVIMGADGV